MTKGYEKGETTVAGKDHARPNSAQQTAAPSQLSKEEIARYSRHLIMPEVGMDGQRKLKAASVLLIGAGGLGSPLGLYHECRRRIYGATRPYSSGFHFGADRQYASAPFLPCRQGL